MAKSKKTYGKVAATMKARGNKQWARACSGSGGYLFNSARNSFSGAAAAKKKSR